MLEFVDPALEWTYLDPAFEDPAPATCRSRDELRPALERQAGQGLVSEIEEIAASNDEVMVVTPYPWHRLCAGPPGRGPQLPRPDA